MFQNRDIVCFLGDSITASGLWEAEVYQFLRKKRPIKCYNCGVSGANAASTVGYLYSECLCYNPDIVVLMLGMNDFGSHLYTDENLARPELDAEREEKFRIHRDSYEQILRACQAHGARMILCLPTPYDEVSETPVGKSNYQQALDRAADFHREMARKYDCAIVNFKDNMLPLLGKMKIISDDRVHPTDLGYHVMAQIFLKETGEIPETDFETPFVFEEWNRQRHAYETQNSALNFVELCATYAEGRALHKSVTEIQEIVRQRLADPNLDQIIIDAYNDYLTKGHLREYNKSEIVRLTVF